MPPTPLHCVVVGAGIAGLAAAHRLRERRPDLRVTVLEAAPSIGGKLAQAEVGGTVVDTGAEAALNRRPEAVDLIRAVGLADDVCHPAATTAYVWSRDRMRPLPPTVLGVPTDLRAVARSGVLSTLGVGRAALDRVLPGRPTDDDVSVGRVVRRRLGREVSERLLEPLLGGIYAGHADQLSLHAAAPQIAALAARGGSLIGAAAASTAPGLSPSVPLFAGVVGGMGRLPAVVAEAAGAEVRTSTTVRALARSGLGWQLSVGRADRPELLTVDAVVVATPAAPTARLLASVVPGAAAELAGVESASVALVTLAVPASGLPSPLPGSGCLVPPVEGRAMKAATWSSSKWEWVRDRLGADTRLVRVSFGRHGESALLQREDSELVQLAVDELGAAVRMRGPVLDSLVTRWGGALPQYTVGHLDRVRRVRDAVAEAPGLDVCGATYDGVGVAACVADGQRAADRIVAGFGGEGQ